MPLAELGQKSPDSSKGPPGQEERPAGAEAVAAREPVPEARTLGRGAPAAKRSVVLDASACHSARSSNPSEVSEDFRSDWGAPSPASGRSGPLGGALADGQSLEISASAETEAGRSLGLAGSVQDARSRLAMRLDEDLCLNEGAVTWSQLQAELDALASALQGVREIRQKQQQYLRRLKTGA